jgi:hypothetical protein
MGYAHSRVSNFNFDIWIWGGDPIHIPWNITEGRQSSLPLWAYVNGIAGACHWRKCIHGMIKSVKGLGNAFDLITEWQTTLPSFVNFSWDMYRVSPTSKYQSWYLSPCCGLEVVNGIAGACHWRKCIHGMIHLKPTAGCKISTLIFGYGGILALSHLGT